jgi:hypothetical protein
MSINLIKNLYKELLQDIKFITNKSLIYYNKRRLRGLILLEGDLVYLLWKNIKTKHLSLKLNHTKLSLFKI